MENLYNKNHSVFINSNKEKRKSILKIEIESTITSANNKELFIRLIDADSLSFLFCLRINDENFQELKNQQGLLVDLYAFGQKLIDLLELCHSEESNISPKYILSLCGNGDLGNFTLSGGSWTLNFIETNPFKHLSHLSLKFCHGDVDQFKGYLIDCLKVCRMENSNLSLQLQNTTSDLHSKLKDTEICLNETKDQFHKLQISSNVKIEDLRTKLEQQIEKDKEKLFETENYYRNKIEQDKNDFENNFSVKLKKYDDRIQDLEKSNKCLCDENSKLEHIIREMKVIHGNLEESYSRADQEILNLRRNKIQNEKDIHELECQTQKMNTKIAVLMQEVQDKNQILSKVQDQYSTEQDAKSRYLDESNKRGRQVEKLEKAVKSLNDEISKGNEIIQKLQGDVKNCHGKIKVRTQITTEQEKVICERELEIKRLTNELNNIKQEFSKKEHELEKSILSLEDVNKKLEEANHIIKTNENVINWLNRQVTEYELSKQKSGIVGLPVRSQYRPNCGTSADPVVKYKPVSSSSLVSSVISNVNESDINCVLGGIVNREKVLPIPTMSITSNSQNYKNETPRDLTQTPLSTMSDNISSQSALNPKYLAKSTIDRGFWNKSGQPQNQITKNMIYGVPIPEESEFGNSSQQSLSSAYFPKPILGPK